MTKWIVAPLALLAIVGCLAGCSGIPADPDGTLDRIRDGGVLRAGASPAEGLVDVSGGDPDGTLPGVVEDYAASLDAEVEWAVDSEERLVAALERGELDVVIGGMTDASPWTDRAAVTRGYPALAENGRDPVALLAPLGENALLVSLEEHLDEAAG